jgi:hypothetical protein
MAERPHRRLDQRHQVGRRTIGAEGWRWLPPPISGEMGGTV